WRPAPAAGSPGATPCWPPGVRWWRGAGRCRREGRRAPPGGPTMIDPGPAMAVAAGLLLAGVLASKLSDRFGVPSLLLFLAIGVLAGSEGPGGIDFDDYELAQTVGVVALAFILFGGGFDTDWRAVRPVLAPGLLLATVGVAVTAVVTGLVAARVLDVSTTTGLLLGSIVSSTD